MRLLRFANCTPWIDGSPPERDHAHMTTIDRREVSFSQAEGLTSLPQPLALGEASKEFRSFLWAVLYEAIGKDSYAEPAYNYSHALGKKWDIAFRTWYVRYEFKPVDEIDFRVNSTRMMVKELCMNGRLPQLFDFITFLLRTEHLNLESQIKIIFERSRLAYRIEDRTIFPAATPEEGQTITEFFQKTAGGSYEASRKHLRNAGKLLSDGDWAGSVRESIHAVESAARVIEPKANTFADALKKLSNGDRINPNLKRSLSALYDYSSDQQGIRHANVFASEANVDRADATYMLGACAAFVTYLVARK